jgi:hypothetical protein
LRRTGNCNGKSEIRGFFAALRMTKFCVWVGENDNCNGNPPFPMKPERMGHPNSYRDSCMGGAGRGMSAGQKRNGGRLV